MTLGRLVEGRGDDLGVDGASHVGNLLRALVDEQHHEVGLGMIGSDGVGDILHQDGLTRLWLSHDECTLTLTDRREEIDNTSAEVSGGTVATECELLVGEERCKMLERYAVAHLGWLSTVDHLDVGDGEVLLALVRRTHTALYHVAGLQTIALDDIIGHIHIVG